MPETLDHRTYVGDSDWDLISHHVFDFLVREGLREHHRLFDIGAGSFRIGRLLIPWLGKGCYAYYEPNENISDEGLDCEVGVEFARQKQIQRYAKDSDYFDFILAHSIFIHAGRDILTDWLIFISYQLAPAGRALVTIKEGPDHQGDGWRYPGTVCWSFETVARLCAERGLQAEIVDHRHPKHTWVRLTHAS